jgi:uncharacterized HAD superfamily protein
MKIGIDIDEVVAELTKKYIGFYNEKNGTDFKFENMYSHYLEEPLNTTEEKIVELMFKFYETEDFNNLDLVEGAKELISELSKNHEIFFITARPPSVKEKTRFFLEKHFPDVSLNIFHSGDLHGKKKTKAEICLDQGIKFLIEDHHDYALDCARKGVKVFLLEKPWNKNYEDHPNIIRVNHLREILREIK